MTTNIVIQSIPHTGTRFVSKMFYLLGFNRLEKLHNLAEARVNSKQYCVSHFSGGGLLSSPVPSTARVVTPIRDPYLTAISNMYGMNQGIFGMDIHALKRSFDIFIKRARQQRQVYLDIECPEERRLSHLIAVLKQLGVYEDEYLPILTAYADKWKPVGSTNNEWKQVYLKTGELPDCIRRCDLVREINWHNKVKQECVYDYIA